MHHDSHTFNEQPRLADVNRTRCKRISNSAPFMWQASAEFTSRSNRPCPAQWPFQQPCLSLATRDVDISAGMTKCSESDSLVTHISVVAENLRSTDRALSRVQNPEQLSSVCLHGNLLTSCAHFSQLVDLTDLNLSANQITTVTVSYTHLTLPTILLV